MTEDPWPQDDIGEADTNQAADLETHGLPEAADLAIAALAQQDVKPAVSALADAGLDDLLEVGRAVVQFDTVYQALEGLLRYLAQDTHGIFPLDCLGGVHKLVSQIAIIGQQQQAGGIDVQAAHGDPAPLFQGGQMAKDGGAALGIMAGDDLALRLVVGDDTQGLGAGWGQPQVAAIQADPIPRGDAVTQLGDLAIDLDPSRLDPALDLTPRAESGVGQDLLDADWHGAAGFGGGAVGGGRGGYPGGRWLGGGAFVFDHVSEDRVVAEA